MTISTKSWSIIELLHWGTEHFTKKGIENSRREMEWLLCNVLSYNRIDLYLKFENLKYQRFCMLGLVLQWAPGSKK